MRLDGRLQVLHECGDNIGRHRTCPSHSQETVLPRAGPISKFRVAKTDLGTSTRVVLRRGNLKRVDLCRVASRNFVTGCLTSDVTQPLGVSVFMQDMGLLLTGRKSD